MSNFRRVNSQQSRRINSQQAERDVGRLPAGSVTRLVRVAGRVLVWGCVLLVVFPADAFASGNDVGANVANLLKGYAGDLYGGIVAVISLTFLLNRRYTELAVFLFAAIVVAWMVFAPSEIASAAEGIGKQIFG